MNIKFAERLKELREEMNISQNQLSKELKMSQAAISKWESGDRLPSVDLLWLLADYFKCSTDYLLGRVD